MLNDRYICTGPPGSGKTSVLEYLKADFVVVSEPARRVLAQQRASGGRGTGDQDTALFVSLMLQAAIADFETAPDTRAPILFDRGLPDLLAFAAHYELPNADIIRAVFEHRYTATVFWFPAWEDIYVNDDERTLDFRGAEAFGERIRTAYTISGYTLIDVPLAAVAERAEFIRKHVC